MRASLPMYDWPETAAATDRWWQGLARHIRAHGLTPPEALTRGGDYAALWSAPDLLISQACGYPFTHALAGRAAFVGTPSYEAPDAAGGRYRSLIFVRSGEAEVPAHLIGRWAAINNPDSMSGMLALKLVFAPLAAGGRFFSSVIETGGHLRSLAAVREGRADVCAIDSICVGLAMRHRPELLAGLTAIARSPVVPALPYITSEPQRAPALRAALAAALADDTLADCRADLLITGLSDITADDYAVIPALEAEMEAGGGLLLL